MITGGLCLLLLCFLLWKETTRINRARRVARISAVILAVFSLYLLAIPVFFEHTKTIRLSHEAILITDGADADSLYRFQETRKDEEMPIFCFSKSPQNVTGKGWAAMKIEPRDLLEKRYRVLHVFGYGLTKEELEIVKDQPVFFHASAAPKNINTIHWQPIMASGEKLVIQGTFHNTSGAAAKIALLGFDHTLDSAFIPAGKINSFRLATVPKQSGRGVYNIIATTNKDTLEKEPVPVQVIQAPPIKVFMLASSPDFENKFLKNWLAQKGYEVVVRTTISKNKTSKAFLNTAAFTIDNLTPELLDRFDLTIADAGELSALTNGELQSLRSAIDQKGRGLIVRADSAAAHTSFYTNLFPVLPGDSSTQHPLELHLLPGNSTLQPLAAATHLFIRVQDATQPLITDKEGRVLVNSALYGSGKILFSTLPNTFSWVLSGNTDDYDQVWSELLSKAIPKKTVDEAWHISPSLARVNEPINLSLETAATVAPRGQVEGAVVDLSNHSGLSFRWNGLFWPVKTGWQTGIQLNGDPFYWYVYGNNDWKNISLAANRLRTEQISRPLTTNNENIQSTATEKQAFPKIVFFLIFLVSCGYLWFENKYYNS